MSGWRGHACLAGAQPAGVAPELDFDRDVSACVPSATIVSDIPGSGMIGVRTNAGQDRALFVETTNRAGALTNQSFYLLLVC